MPEVTAAFRSESELIHHEHRALSSELAALEFALDSLICYSEVFTNLAATERVYRCGRHLARTLPEHFENEEATVLAEIAGVSPELDKFAEEMKRQHRELRQKLTGFCLLIDQVENSNDIEQTVFEVKERGLELARSLAAHMDAEERKFSSMAH
ncbi:MAG TPA: hemerythrin domain-containing protein [Terriglobales bacterium]|nr:hemerythrin domain-containing protein [Terriglobales bacterium]